MSDKWGVAHASQFSVRVGIEYCRLLAGIGAPRVTFGHCLAGHSMRWFPSIFSPQKKKKTIGGLILSNVTPCFTPGALIATSEGWRPVETLRRGDRIVTRDNGLKRIYWIGRRDVAFAELQETPELRPILIRKGALGSGIPSRDMLVSRNHRFLVGDAGSDVNESLIAACHMGRRDRIGRASVLGVSYLHLLFQAHEVILANGAWTESFHPDDDIMKNIGHRQRREILNLFPEIATLGAARRFPAARPIKKPRFEV